MKFELKNVKHAQFASQETPCYEATLYIDGHRVARVSNEGHGGTDLISPLDDGDQLLQNKVRLEEAQAWIADHGEPLDLGEDYGSVPRDLEIECHELLEEYLLERDVKRRLKRQILFIVDGKEGVRYIKGVKPTQDNLREAKLRHPEWRILNLLSVKQAVRIFAEEG